MFFKTFSNKFSAEGVAAILKKPLNRIIIINMKNIALTLFILLIAVTSASADEAFFPARSGTVLLTANLNANGRIEGYNRMTVREIRGSGGNLTAVYTIQVLDRNRRPVRNSAERQYTINITNGVSMYRLDDIMDAFFLTRGFDYTMTAGNMPIPSNLAPGTRLQNTWLKINVSVPIIGTVTADTSITNLVCAGIETITVRAGTFEAYKITQRSTTITTGWASPQITNTGATWYVRGIGVVKSVSYDDKGKIESSSELYELIN